MNEYIEFSHFFFFAISRTEFFLAKRKSNGIIHVQPSVFRINSFSPRISLPGRQTVVSVYEETTSWMHNEQKIFYTARDRQGRVHFVNSV